MRCGPVIYLQVSLVLLVKVSVRILYIFFPQGLMCLPPFLIGENGSVHLKTTGKPY